MKTQRRRQQAEESTSNNMARIEKKTKQQGQQKIRARVHAFENAGERRAQKTDQRQKVLRTARDQKQRNCTWSNEAELEQSQPPHAKPTAAAKMRCVSKPEVATVARSRIESSRTARQEKAAKLAATVRLWRSVAAERREIPAASRDKFNIADFRRAVQWIDAGFGVKDAWEYGAVMKEAVRTS
jgi:hypothetical protein